MRRVFCCVVLEKMLSDVAELLYFSSGSVQTIEKRLEAGMVAEPLCVFQIRKSEESQRRML